MTSFLRELHWLPIRYRIIFKLSPMMHNAHLIVVPDRCTYVNEALGHSSCIDHFVSAAVRSAINCISIVDSAVNNSDHRPVLLGLDSSFCLSPTSRNNAPVSEHKAYNIRWDKGDISAYYGL